MVPTLCMQDLQLDRCVFPPSALLELAPLSRLVCIAFNGCDDSIGCPEGMAMLTELCSRLGSMEEAFMDVHDVDALRPGPFSWVGAASQAQKTLEARGKLVTLWVENA